MPFTPHAPFVLDINDKASAAKEGDFPAADRLATADGATIVAFRFAPVQRLDSHHAPHPISVQVIEGEVEFAVARKASDPSEVDDDEFTATTLTPGMVQYVPAFVVHHVTSKDGAIMQLTLHTGDHEGYQGHSGKPEKLPFEKYLWVPC